MPVTRLYASWSLDLLENIISFRLQIILCKLIIIIKNTQLLNNCMRQVKEWRDQQLRKKTRGGESDTSLLSSFGKDSGEGDIRDFSVGVSSRDMTFVWVSGWC